MVRLDLSIRGEFHSAVHSLNEMIGQSGGWIVSHQFFSNIMAMIAFECPRAALPGLVEAIAKAGFQLHTPAPDIASLSAKAGEDVRGQISLSVLHDGPDVKRPVPAFG